MINVIKVQTLLDYIIYLAEDGKIIGFEITPEAREHLRKKYRLRDEEENIPIPEGAVYFLELSNIPTFLLLILGLGESGEISYYKPGFNELAKDINKEIDNISPIEEEEKEEEEVFTSEPSMALIRKMKDIPYQDWMLDFWGTKLWMTVWKERKDQQTEMVNFSKLMEEAEKEL